MAGYSFREQADISFTYVALMVVVAMPRGSTRKLFQTESKHLPQCIVDLQRLEY
jgi:hypothetical protein